MLAHLSFRRRIVVRVAIRSATALTSMSVGPSPLTVTPMGSSLDAASPVPTALRLLCAGMSDSNSRTCLFSGPSAASLLRAFALCSHCPVTSLRGRSLPLRLSHAVLRGCGVFSRVAGAFPGKGRLVSLSRGLYWTWGAWFRPRNVRRRYGGSRVRRTVCKARGAPRSAPHSVQGLPIPSLRRHPSSRGPRQDDAAASPNIDLPTAAAHSEPHAVAPTRVHYDELIFTATLKCTLDGFPLDGFPLDGFLSPS